VRAGALGQQQYGGHIDAGLARVDDLLE
jgi:hypothetical protein